MKSSACSLTSHDSRNQKNADPEVFINDFSRRNSKEKPRFESPTVDAKTLESCCKNVLESREAAEVKKSILESNVTTRSNGKVLENNPRNICRVDVATEVNFSSCNFSRSESPETRPVERAIEARSGSEDGLGSMVRCLHFAHTYIANRKLNSIYTDHCDQMLDKESCQNIFQKLPK